MSNNQLFIIDFYIQIVRLLPTVLRQPIMIAWLFRLMLPMYNLYATFLGFRNITILMTSLSSQTYSLEFLLNYIWNSGFVTPIINHSIDYSNGGIWIENNPQQLPQQYVWGDFDNQPTLIVYSELDPVPANYVYSWDDYWSAIDFIVHVPSAITFDALQMEAIVNHYNVVGKKIIIQTY